MNVGISAAFHEINSLGGVRGIKLKLSALDDGYEPDRSEANTVAFTTNSSIFALVGEVGTPTSKTALPVATAAKFPFIGAFTGASLLRTPYQRYAVNFRASYIDETAAMVEYLVRHKSIRRISIMIQNDSYGLAGKEGVDIATKSNNLRIFSEGRYTRNTEDISQGLSDIATKSDDPTLDPQAVIMIGAYNPLAEFVIQAKKQWPDIMFLTVSFTGATAFAEQLKIRAERESVLNWNDNVIMTQCVPLPTDTTNNLVATYQAALSAFDSSETPGFVSLEGYMVGWMVIESLFRIPGEITREAFLDAVYQSGSFHLHGQSCGPFSANATEDLTDGTGCNQCMRNVWATVFDEDEDFTELPVANFEFSTCGYEPKVWETLEFGLTTDTSSKGREKDVVDGINAAFRERNDAGGIHGHRLLLNVKDDGGDLQTAASNIADFAANEGILALLGVESDANTAMAVQSAASLPVIAPLSGIIAARVPFTQNVINLRVCYEDETAEMVNYLYTSRLVKRIGVVMTLNSQKATDGFNGIELALASRRLEVYSKATVSANSTTASAKDTVDSLSVDDTPPEAIIFLTSDWNNNEKVIAMIEEAKANGVTKYFFTPDKSLASFFTSATDTSNILMTSVLPPVTDTSFNVVSEFRNALSKYDSSLIPSDVSFEAYLAARTAIKALEPISNDYNRENFIQSFYEGGTYKVHEVYSGPYNNIENEECNRGLHRLWAVGMNNQELVIDDEASASMSSLQRCGFVPMPQYDFKESSFRMVFVILAGIIILLIVGIFITLCAMRSNYVIKPNFYFLLLTAVGLILSSGVTIITSVIPTPFLCAFVPWYGHLAFATTYAPLFAQTNRLAVLFNNRGLKKLKLNNWWVGRYIAGIMLLFIGLLLGWTASGLPKFTEAVTPNGERYETCDASASSEMQVAVLAVEALLLGWGSLLCYKVHDIDGKFAYLNDSKTIGICIYNAAFFGLLLVFLTLGIELEPNTLYMVQSILISLNTLTTVAVMYIKKINMAFKKAGVSGKSSAVTGTTSGNNTTRGPESASQH